MVTAVTDQGGFDVAQAPRTMVLGWLQEIVNEIVARAKWNESTFIIGTTTAGQAEYPISTQYVEIDEIAIGTARASRVTIEQYWALVNGDLILYPGRSVFAPSFLTVGSPAIVIFPTPSVTGLNIAAHSAQIAATLVDNSSAITTVPADMHGRIVDEGIRLGRRRIFGVEYDEATREGLVQALRERRNSRLGGGTQQLVVLRRRRR